VSRTQYVYAIAIPLLAFLIVRTLPSKENASIPWQCWPTQSRTLTERTQRYPILGH